MAMVAAAALGSGVISLPLGADCIWSRSNAKSKLRRSWKQMQCRSSSRDDGRGDEEEKENAVERIAKELEVVLRSGESKALLEELDEAARRVERARKELESLDDPERRNEQVEAEVGRRIRGELMEQVVEECEEELAAAEAEARAAQAALVALRAGQELDDSGEANQVLERIESVKAAVVASLGGAFSSLPFLLAEYSTVGTLLVSEATVVLSCALYGVCYRYIVRRDLANVQLKSGSVAAFALARGLGLLDAVQREHLDKDWLLLAATYLGQSAAIFLSAALALDLCLRSQVITPFPRQDKV